MSNPILQMMMNNGAAKTAKEQSRMRVTHWNCIHQNMQNWKMLLIEFLPPMLPRCGMGGGR